VTKVVELSLCVFIIALTVISNNRILKQTRRRFYPVILPFAIALGSLLFLTFPSYRLIIIKGVDGSFSSINSAIELSIMPIPLQTKNQARIIYRRRSRWYGTF
jgi:AAA family ATP:ADP antiporter